MNPAPASRLFGLPVPASWAPAMARWQAYWTSLSPRERAGVSAAAAALVGLALVALLVNPAWRTLREAPERLAQLEAQQARMQTWAAEAQRLQAQAPVAAAQAQAALKAATEALGADARLTLQGDRATLNFSHVEGTQLLTWLAEVRRAARARPVEARWQRGPEGYTGSVVLALAVAP